MNNRIANVSRPLRPTYRNLSNGPAGCMESLVFYKRLLLRKYAESLTDKEQQKLENDCADLLVQLQRVDPDRKQRYDDLCKSSLVSLIVN